MALIDIIGQKFGRLEVIEFSGKDKWQGSLWKCRCACGSVGVYKGRSLRIGHTKSCGCWYRESAPWRHKTHGQSPISGRTPEYSAWRNMIQRCEVPKSRNYPDYGGRGIRVCESWKESFRNFFHDIGPRPSTGHSLHRIDNEKGYSLENVKWATKSEQLNCTRHNVMIEYNGLRQSLANWSRQTGINAKAIQSRLKAGWSASQALTAPSNKANRKAN